MKKTFILLIITSLAFSGVKAQGTLKAALNELKSHGKYETLVYYGVDLSHVHVNDAPKIPRSVEYSQVYPSAWISFIEKELPPDGYVRPALRFSNFTYAQQEIFDKSINADPQLIVGYDSTIPPDSIAAIVSGYLLQSKAGLGLVLIPENFSKPKETATTWVVFFDITSRKIIYMTKIFGKCDHMGYTAHWGSGVVEGFRYFLNH